MSEAIDQNDTEQACVGNGDDTVGVLGAKTMNIRVLSENSSSTMSVLVDDGEFISPRASRSTATEEEMVVSNTKIKSRHKWIEETLLKDNRPLSETTRKLLSRRSLPSSTPPGPPLGVEKSPQHSLGSKEDTITRARAAIEGRRQSRETARAKVSAAMASIADEVEVPSISFSTSSLKENDSEERNESPTRQEKGTAATVKEESENVFENTADRNSVKEVDNEIRAKARARLDATMALLAGKSAARRRENSAEESIASNASIHRNINTENAVQSPIHNPAITNEKTDSPQDAIGEEEDRPLAGSIKKTEQRPAKPDRLGEGRRGRILVEQYLKEEENTPEEKGLATNQDRRADHEKNTEEVGKGKDETIIENEADLAKDQHQEDRQRDECETRQSANAQGSKEETGLGTSKQTELEEQIHRKGFFFGQGQDDDEACRLLCAEAECVMEEKTDTSIVQEKYVPNQSKDDKEARRSAQTIEEARLAVEAFKQAEYKRIEVESVSDGDDTPTIQITQPSVSYDPNPIKSSSCSTGITQQYDKPSDEDSDETSLGQVDRILYQGKQRKGKKCADDHLPRDDSEEREFEAVSGSFESGSQPSNAGVFNIRNTEVYHEGHPPGGPMWKRAVEEAAFATALANDLLPREAPPSTGIELDPSPFISPDPSNLTNTKASHDDELSYSNYGFLEEDNDGDWPEEPRAVQDDESQWKGFKPERMKLMVALGILGGLLPSFYVVTTCHFVTGKAAIGDDDVEFGIYYGLSKFTPIDSAFQGYSYCQSYDSEYNYNPPTVPRVASIAAIIFGSIPLLVIGIYLLYSLTHELAWMGSMWMLYIAFVCQITTLSIFLFGLCQDGIECSMGPGAIAAGICSIVWFLLSMEMKINSPLIQPVQTGGGIVVIEKDSAIVSGVKKKYRKVIDLVKGEDARTPSLSRTARFNGRIGVAAPSETSSYKAPGIV